MNLLILFLLLIIMIFFTIKKNIVVIGNKARESYLRNPFYEDRIIDLEK